MSPLLQVFTHMLLLAVLMKCTPSMLPAFPDSSLTHSPFLSQLGHIFLLKAFSFFKHPSSRPLLYDFTVLSHFLCYDVYLWKQPFPDSTSISPPPSLKVSRHLPFPLLYIQRLAQSSCSMHICWVVGGLLKE